MELNNENKPQNEDINLSPEEELKNANQGVVGDSFSEIGDIPATEDEDLKNRFDAADGIEVEYAFNGQQVKKALKIFQKHTLYKKYLIYTLLLVLMLILYVYRLATNYSKVNLFMAILCVIVILFVWYVPLTHIRQIAKGVEASGLSDTFKITFYDEGIKLGEGESSTVFMYETEPLKAWETDDMFVIGYAKERVFAIPKSYCEDNTEKISLILQNGLKEKYKRL